MYSISVFLTNYLTNKNIYDEPLINPQTAARINNGAFCFDYITLLVIGIIGILGLTGILPLTSIGTYACIGVGLIPFVYSLLLASKQMKKIDDSPFTREY